MGKTICCGNCGGSYDDELPKCPYCGSIHISGAEKEYMEKLEDVREELEELDEVPVKELHAVVKKTSRTAKEDYIDNWDFGTDFDSIVLLDKSFGQEGL